MNDFRLASRELFNTRYRVQDPWMHQDDAWAAALAFREVEQLLYETLVLRREELPFVKYGQEHVRISVCAASDLDKIPADINREADSGYWDFCDQYIPSSADMRFISYFDFSELDIKDNEFVRLRIISCSDNAALDGKQALVRARYVRFCAS
jgi:hypothetical protein